MIARAKQEDQDKVVDLILPIKANLVNNSVPERRLPKVIATL